EVQDTGIGIPPAEVHTIFEPFEQVGDAHRRSGGTGLGLAISRQLVRLMGSEVHVESRPGAGSVFWFDLSLPLLEPADVVDAPLRRVVTGYAGTRRKVLIVDDVAGNRAMLVDLLTPLGFDTCEAADGQQALQQMEDTGADIVLMDMAMPVMDGPEAIGRLRAMPRWAQLPIIAVSANALDVDRAQCIAAGASGFLPKPIDRDGLLDLIGKQLGLDWQLQSTATTVSAVVADTATLVAPAEADLEALHRLALAGNMRAIRERAAEVAAQDPTCRAFCDKLQQLASAYQSKAILGLLKACLEKSRA
ncbi:MAG TPA: response regulator, partial [Albitalea sp.]|nr:response regulator [Albitalea sp.]